MASLATYSKASSQAGETVDISAQGLTAPAHMRWPIDVTKDATLREFYYHNNQLTGSIPSLSANTTLLHFYCQSNKLTGWAGGTVSNTIFGFRAESNALSETAVNGLLVAFDTAGRASGTLNLGGGTNAALTGAGATAKASLTAKGWAVTTN